MIRDSKALSRYGRRGCPNRAGSASVLVVACALSFVHCSSSDSSNNKGAALAEFLAKLPGALCQHYVACGFIQQADVASCEDDLRTEIPSVSCDAMETFYRDHQKDIDACLDGSRGSCDSDDLAYFCPPLGGVDIEHVCDPPPKDGGASLTLAQLAVGGWTASGTCDGTEITVGWFLCPGGRLRGGETVGGYGFLNCGTWSATASIVTVSYDTKAVLDPTITDHHDIDLAYESDADTLTWKANCPVQLHRVDGEVTEQDCASSSCTAGGSGSVSCNIDCDCGRCWYCDSGTCRYGGGGPYGCYRGCGI